MSRINIVFIHGAGYSQSTFGALLPFFHNYNITTVDLPGHGPDGTGDGVVDLSVGSLKRHLDRTVNEIESLEATVIVGHSLGGSLATFYPSAMAVCIIDITEGTAIKSLDSMPLFLERRPPHFGSMSEAVRWYRMVCPHCTIPEQSMAGQLKQTPSGWTWRVDLLKARQHWKDWFTGMDERLLACNNPLLILSDRELLDRSLLIASMQGRFQIKVIGGSGHAIQEDRPEELAQCIIAHIERISKLRTVLANRH